MQELIQASTALAIPKYQPPISTRLQPLQRWPAFKIIYAKLNFISAKLRNSVFTSIVRQEVAFFDRNKTGELINRLSADTLLVSQAITQQISDGLRSVFMAGAGIGMMVYMSPQLAFVSLGVVPPVAAWAVITGRKVRAAGRDVQDALARATDVADERIANIRTVKAFAKESAEMERYNKEMKEVVRQSTKEALIQAKFFGMVI